MRLVVPVRSPLLLLAIAALPGAALAGDVPGQERPAGTLRKCTTSGSGFYVVPGTDTCLRLGGYVWAEGYYNSYTDYPPADAETYSIATYGLVLDARDATDYGTLRSYMEIRLQYRGAEEWGSGPPATEVDIWDAHVEFAGFTFGKTQSIFDFYANQNVLGTDPATIGDQQQTTIGAYRWNLANGWAATLSLEDAALRAAGVSEGDPRLGAGVTQSSDLPELVAAISQSGDWGQFQLSGALHQIRASVTALEGSPVRAGTSEDWGYALQAGIMFNLPALGAGDTLYLQTAYTDGATSYLGLIDPSGAFAPPDAYIGADGALSRVSGWNVTAQLLHNWSDTWQSTLFGGYARYDLNDAATPLGDSASHGINYNVGGNIVWSPLPAFSLILQYDYNVIEAQGGIAPGAGLTGGSQQAQQLLLMAQRLF
ncbi:porin [Ancylobacter sp. A5.8]|uniref:porin n=1 Tax=Ancylobacter gelatini TaxID=2919920 RepID=UPI001F4EB0D2|nr:porin [Ancylobacter gelatini]MCJ8142155.1 porin [Ancylobacter gelatini]